MKITRIAIFIGLIALGSMLSSCRKECMRKSDPLTKIAVSTATNGFVDANGDRFIPWGYNYLTRDKFLEDQWESESQWPIMEDDFKEMKCYAGNTVRLHLQFGKFMDDPTTPNSAALERLSRLVDIAEKRRIYLIITGLAEYRASDAPSWYDQLSDSARWESQAVFWQSVAGFIGNRNSVFAYDLMNEPVVSVRNSDGSIQWLPGDGFGGYHFVQNITRDSTETFGPTMHAWIAKMTAAIRAVDTQTLITVGFLPLGTLTAFENDLDFISTHIYPGDTTLQQWVDYVAANQGSKPFMLTELGNMNGTEETFKAFVNATATQVDGAMAFYEGMTTKELDASGTMPDAIQRVLIDLMVELDPND